MNIINNLLDEQYVIKLFKKEVLPKYPSFSDIKKIEIITHKDHIWETTYHVVIEFKTEFFAKDGQTKILSIFCSAHSDEPRQNVYQALKYLWDNGFANDSLTTPHPLFYSDYFKATFYRGVQGNNLYHYIRKKNYSEIEKIIPKAAQWFAKLHKMPANKAQNFNPGNSRIKTVIPGKDYILNDIANQYPHYHETYKKIYKILIAKEEEFLASTPKRWLIHGDAHPENIIKMGERKLAVIDFTDICLADFARDLGCFLQQLEYMVMRKINDKKYTDKIKKIFLDNYLDNAKIELDKNLQTRIDTYYNWTAMRTATHHLIKDGAEPKRAVALIESVKDSLKI